MNIEIGTKKYVVEDETGFWMSGFLTFPHNNQLSTTVVSTLSRAIKFDTLEQATQAAKLAIMVDRDEEVYDVREIIHQGNNLWRPGELIK